MSDQTPHGSYFLKVPVPSFQIKLDGSIVQFNDAFKQLLKIPEDVVLEGESINQFIRSEQADIDWLSNIISGNKQTSLELQGINWNGETIWIESFTYVEKNQAGKPFTIAGSWVDITGKKLASQDNKRLLEVIKQAPISLVLTDLNGKIYYVNSHFSKVTGFRADEVLGKKPSFLKSGLHETRFYKELWDDITNERVWNGVFINKRKNGSLFYEDATVFPLQGNDGKAVGFASVKLDITKQYKMQQELLLTGQVLHSIFENMQEGIVRLTLEGNIDMINSTLCRELDLDPEENYIGENIDELTTQHPINFQEIIDKIALDEEVQHLLVEEYPKYYRINGKLLKQDQQRPHFIVSIENISDEKILERQLIEAQKIEALGKIAEGIAHDFNNILSNIYSSEYLLENDLKNVNVPDLLAVIRKSVQRGKNITERMLTFVGSNEPEKQLTSITKTLDDIAYLVEHSLPKNIHFRYVNPKSEYFLNADPQHMGQMFLNLILNGSDSMPMGGIVDLEIIENVPQSIYHGPADKNPEDFIVFLIKDSGNGIEKDILDKVFEPFFTTKPIGKGSGLGLPVVKKIVNNHFGWINMESQLGFGTTVYVGLPKAVAPEEGILPLPGEHLSDSPELIFDQAKLLIVEDEAELRELLKYILKKSVKEIDTAENGRAAIDLFTENEGKYDLVITDLGLPDFRGATVIKRIQEINPKQPIIAMTGYLSDAIFNELQELGIEEIIRKPFEIGQFKQTIFNYLSST